MLIIAVVCAVWTPQRAMAAVLTRELHYVERIVVIASNQFVVYTQAPGSNEAIVTDLRTWTQFIRPRVFTDVPAGSASWIYYECSDLGGGSLNYCNPDRPRANRIYLHVHSLDELSH